MIILGIETSCDETSAAIVEKNEDKLILRSNIVASSLPLHAQTGGIIPENAAREQIKYILPVINEALQKAFDTPDTFDTFATLKHIDAIAVTNGPGLIGSLLVGVETAKTLALILAKPLIPVNHMLGHIYANWLTANSPTFPALALVVSGGHTDLLLLANHNEYKLLGGTRDDAAGEAFDKIGRLLGLPYPAGPTIEEKAKKGDPKRFVFPRPLIGSGDYDFSFSGLKTAVLREIIKLDSNKKLDPKPYTLNPNLDEQTICDLANATQEAIISVLTKKTLKAAQEYQVESILLSGGVAANQTLKEKFEQLTKDRFNFFVPTKNLCTDNGAMIAAAAAFNFQEKSWEEITANPQLYFT